MVVARKKGPLNPLHISMPAQMPHIAVALQGNDETSTLSSAASESDYPPFKPRSLRNMKKLSLSISSAQSSTTSLNPPSEPQSATSTNQPEASIPMSLAERRRRSSVISLPTSSTPAAAALYHRKEHERDREVPYADGPVQILPGIWLGSEDNARDWKGLVERGIKSILNVAKEVNLPFDSIHHGHPLRSSVSSPNLHSVFQTGSTYYPPHVPSGRPAMHYLKLQWSHGQQDLVANGFPEAMSFTDAVIERGEGVLIHCQCGISRSATMVIALVMRAAAERSPSVPSEIWALKGMQGAYDYVKEKSKWIGPNMSLIYQLLDYERKLTGEPASPSDKSSILADEEEEWGRRRKLLDEEIVASPDERESSVVMQEAQALDKAMEDRIEARRVSTPSIFGGGVGMGSAWKTRYAARKRTGSIASNMTSVSILSEDLVEEDEERELLHIGGGFDDKTDGELTSTTTSPDESLNSVSPTTTTRNFGGPPPSAPIWKTSFSLPPAPFTAARPTFDLPPKFKGKRRPVSLSLLPPVPPSPIQIVVDVETPDVAPTDAVPKMSIPSLLHLKPLAQRAHRLSQTLSPVAQTPSQTLFVFPPSPTQTTRTPSTMTITTNSNNIPFPSTPTPRVSTFRSHGRTKSFIGLGAPPTPTTAFSKVDARGYFGSDL